MANDGEHTPDSDDADWEIAQQRADVFRRLSALARGFSRLTPIVRLAGSYILKLNVVCTPLWV
jgi:hypothetical protein